MDLDIAEMVKDRKVIPSVLQPIYGYTTRKLQNLLNGSCMTYFLVNGRKCITVVLLGSLANS